jgi:hypothetical protein
MHILKCRLYDAFGRQTVRLRADSKSARLLRAPRRVESRAGLHNTTPGRRHRAKRNETYSGPEAQQIQKEFWKIGSDCEHRLERSPNKNRAGEGIGLVSGPGALLTPNSQSGL